MYTTNQNQNQNQEQEENEYLSRDEVQAITDGTQSVQHDAFDVIEYDNSVANSRKLQIVQESSSVVATGQALIRDTFFAFNQSAPQLVDADQLRASYRVNRALVEQMMSTAEFAELHTATAGDETLATIATVGASKKLISTLNAKTRDEINELSKLEDEIEKLMDEKSKFDNLDELETDEPSDEADEDGDEGQGQGQDEPGDDGQSEGEGEGEAAQQEPEPGPELSAQDQAEQAALQAQIAELQEKAEAMAQALESKMEDLEDAARRAVRPALEETNSEIVELVQAIKAFGGGYDPGMSTNPAQRLSPAQKVEMAQKMRDNNKLRQIADLTGRLTRIALKTQKERVQHEPDEVIGVKTGQDIPHLVASEMSLLTDPALEDLFYLKFAESKLTQYDLDRKENQGRGPIIVALDSSGSMTQPGGGGYSREVWSKGVAIAMMAIARLQKRDIAIIHFSSGEQVKSFDFKKGQSAPMDVVECAEFFYGAGTNYTGWMTQALKLVENSRFDKADVIIVSDGDIRLDQKVVENWNKARDERKMRCHSILIGETYGRDALQSISEKEGGVVNMQELTGQNEKDALGMAFSV